MQEALITTGWVVITILFIALQHGYNWLARKIGMDDEQKSIQFAVSIVYIALNCLYFYFTYNVFKII